MTTAWKEFNHKNYSGVALWCPPGKEAAIGEWIGEFNYPVRRVVRTFIGKTVDETRDQFIKGVEAYYSQVQSVGLKPEPEGLLGAAVLLEMDRRAREWEMGILDWPQEINARFVLVIEDIVSMSHTSISYNQSALDELRVWLHSNPTISISAFKKWAERVWIAGELERTAAGIAVSKARDVALNRLS